MQGKWMILAAGAVLSVGLGAAGCASHESGAQDPVAKRFQGAQAGQEASGSTMDLTDRVTQLAERAATLQQQNQQLSLENERLGKQVSTLEAQLKQTQTELTEANNLLIEMLGELNNWKSDILGFRGEMRQAAKAQLEALLKIMEVLGAEGSVATPAPGAAEPNQPKPGPVGVTEPSKATAQ
jgi:DNA repair exonuclease SbcCD ATPase subunit